MIDEIRGHFERVPLVPFSIRMSDGHEYRVPTVDHALITRRRTCIVVSDDDYAVSALSVLRTGGVVHQANGQ